MTPEIIFTNILYIDFLIHIRVLRIQFRLFCEKRQTTFFSVYATCTMVILFSEFYLLDFV
jgi:hypothetical protein